MIKFNISNFNINYGLNEIYKIPFFDNGFKIKFMYDKNIDKFDIELSNELKSTLLHLLLDINDVKNISSFLSSNKADILPVMNGLIYFNKDSDNNLSISHYHTVYFELLNKQKEVLKMVIDSLVENYDLIKNHYDEINSLFYIGKRWFCCYNGKYIPLCIDL